MWPRVMRNVVDVSSFFLVEATGDSEADRRRRRGPAQDDGGDDDDDGDDDDSSSTADEMDIDAESRSSKSKTVVFGRRPAGDRQQVKCCEFVRAWIEDCCRCKSRLIQKDHDDDYYYYDKDEEDEDEVSSEVIKKVAAASVDSDNNITMAADDDEKEKSRRFWETCLAS